MRRFGFFGFLVFALLVGAVGVVAYDMGISTGAADAAIAEGATVVYQPAAWSPFGLLFGLFFLFLLIGFLGKVFFRPWSPTGHRGWGGRHWASHDWAGHHDRDHEDVPDPFRPMLEKWHHQVHETPAGPAEASSAPGAPSAPQGGPSPQGPNVGAPGTGGPGQPPTWTPGSPPR
jgi:hypothetical protein